ncbi:ATP-grasp domain-containing protein [Geodermatophilus sp. DSM 44513]|uniref:ATP-grasp domain-containing protein n=1 Tax=Geodermatophilus sp. DSM 44513 TaxID=1528104 RepID=UPI0028F70F9A|nr:ATP-grasp domain-containing protein [Geodermatophilus sp. DSM 44513]WNV75139.1 ATP-grasp domain-containing protein [Geodermatophilus sp. DSM 44513]
MTTTAVAAVVTDRGRHRAGRPRRPRRPRRSGRRLLPVLLDLALAVVICAVGFRYGADLLQVHEARWVAAVLGWVGVDSVSGSLERHVLVFRPDGEIILAEVTESCSAILSVLGLTALTAVVLRGRRQHAVAGLVVAVAALLVLNHLRLVGSTVAGLVWGTPALVLFHDWVGTVWNLAATLGGFLLMVCLTLPAAERAEQDVAGRHTARRPDSWARPGLGYRPADDDVRTATRRVNLTGLVYRYMLPTRVARWMGARREAGRIDYRIGHLPSAERAARVRALAADGLGAHAASLVAVATYDEDPAVLDALAAAIAARQWEPVTSPRVAALRLWARAWLLQHPERDTAPGPAAPGPAAPDPAAPDPAEAPTERLSRAAPPRRPPVPPAPVRPDDPGRPMTASLPSPRPPAAHPPSDGPAVLVTGAGGPAGVAVVRRLVALGHRVVAADADSTAAGGALAHTAVTLPRGDHPRFVDALLGACTAYGVDALVGTVAEELPALAAAAGRLAAAGVATWLPDAAAVDLCCDKAAFARAMAAAGVPHPATAASVGRLAGVPGPWVVKPVAGRGSRGVQLLDDRDAVLAALRADGELIVQTRLTGREFTADALVDRDGAVRVVVPRWREETRAGISVKGRTFASAAVTEVVTGALAAVRLTGPANVQGFVADDGTATVVEINPRFSGGLPLTLAAGADVVGAYLAGVRGEALPELDFRPGIAMSRYFAETYRSEDGTPVEDPCAPVAVRA